MSLAAERPFAAGQLAPWHGVPLDAPDAVAAYAAMQARIPGFFLLDLADGEVSPRPKRAFFTDEEVGVTGRGTHPALGRLRAYRRLLTEAMALHRPSRAITIGLFIGDQLGFEPPVPVLAFQKPRGSRQVLLPDWDFLRHDHYRDATFHDPIPFADKRDKAGFVGATSGLPRITLEDVQQLRLPRLRAAVAFRESPLVDFRLPRIVQAASAEVEAAIRALGLDDRAAGWPEMFAYRYLLSMDGNGACCSRVAVALRSNGVLVKYDSPHLLHYFDRLVPWRHYIPVAADAEVPRAMALCAATPGLAESIAEAGRAFHAETLTPETLLAYTAELLAAYAQACRGDLP
jgi:hypothetical protein